MFIQNAYNGICKHVNTFTIAKSSARSTEYTDKSSVTSHLSVGYHDRFGNVFGKQSVRLVFVHLWYVSMWCTRDRQTRVNLLLDLTRSQINEPDNLNTVS